MKRNDRLYYLATPYSHLDQHIREARFNAACDIAGYFLNNGVYVYSPIAHTHPIAVRCELPKGFNFWEGFDLAFLSRCDAMLYVEMPGYMESKGMQAESLAVAGTMPIYRVPFPGYKEWFKGMRDKL